MFFDEFVAGRAARLRPAGQIGLKTAGFLRESCQLLCVHVIYDFVVRNKGKAEESVAPGVYVGRITWVFLPGRLTGPVLYTSS